MIEITESLNPKHRKKEFSCGKEMLDNYLHKQANQDIKRKLAACFVLNDKEMNLLKGYYTLANNSIPQELIPTEFQKKLPKSYISIPTTLLGRLAIDNRFLGKGIGKLLLIDALKRSYEISQSIGSFAVVVGPLDNDAEKFYDQYGFIKLPDSGKMFLPMNIIKSLFG
jgi:predicted GNAT family N-acyltransferase